MSIIKVNQIQDIEGENGINVSDLVSKITLASSTGSSQIGHGVGTVEDALDAVKSVTDSLTSSTGSNSIMYKGRSVSDRLGDSVSVKDHGAVGNGTDATAAFNAALAVSSSVYVPEGVYLIGDVELNGKRLYGNGTILKKSTAQQSIIVKGNGSEVIGLKFKSQSANGQPNTDIRLGDGAKNVRIKGNHFAGRTYSAIYGADDTTTTLYTNPVDGVVIEGNVFDAEDKVNNLRYARHIYLREVKNLVVTGNLFRNSSFDSIRLRGRNGYCIITSNNFTDIGLFPPPDDQTRDAVDTYWGGDLLIVSNNTISGVGYIGLDLKNSARSGVDDAGVVGERTRQFIVTGNIIDKTWMAGIVISGDDSSTLPLHSCIVHGNIIRRFNQSATGTGTGQSGINIKALARHVKISTNIIQEGNARGVFVEGTTAYLDLVFNTIINNAEAGAVLTDVQDMKIIGNTMAQDTNVPNSGQQATGLIVSNPSNLAKTMIMAFNTFKDNGTLQVSLNPSGNRFTGFAQIIGNIESGPGKMSDSYPRTGHSRRIMHGTAIPTSADGTFEVGDILYNVAPVAGGFMGWSCVTAGSPGTWKTFGAISA
ncbi:hypothetical protein pf16_214 [Pseudomonas phage pf16]|uniref:Right handed beta helix domain-containing protein n=1 Tax=Pseudomonas phage pf16 TaxID=1815630 RepID=A0A1S5R3Z6_9CAUD|nr:hypothetical protein FDG98_gp084 [Pseudomonas phage pf16]AND75137.1 hypothetical protein pf16_214 [Pseudomonas phage pf16]